MSFEGPLPFDIQPMAWMADAACQDADPSLFVLEQGQSAAKGREYCDICPVVEACNQYGHDTGSVGLWGGEVISWRRASNRFGSLQDGRPKRLKSASSRSGKRGSTAPSGLPIAARKSTPET